MTSLSPGDRVQLEELRDELRVANQRAVDYRREASLHEAERDELRAEVERLRDAATAEEQGRWDTEAQRDALLDAIGRHREAAKKLAHADRALYATADRIRKGESEGEEG